MGREFAPAPNRACKQAAYLLEMNVSGGLEIAKIRQTLSSHSFRLVSPRGKIRCYPMLLLAATALEKMEAVPIKFWLNLGMAILIFVGSVIVIRKAAEMNKVLLSVVIFVVLTSVGFNWIYARNEPAFMTPYIDPIAAFFPSSESKSRQEKKAQLPD